MKTQAPVDVDVAPQRHSCRAAETAACEIDWREGGRAVVRSVERGLDDDALLALIADVDKVAIDAPFGWPDEL